MPVARKIQPTVPGSAIFRTSERFQAHAVRAPSGKRNVMKKKKKHIIVTVIGRDEVGIVAKIATTMAQHNINIIDINQKILGNEIFAMTLLADRIQSSLSLPEITERLNESVKDMSLKVTVQDSEVFQYMHRV